MATSPDDGADTGAHRGDFLPRQASTRIQVSIAVAAAMFVFRKAVTALSLAASAEPALNPNQPNQRIPVPRST